MLLRIFVCGDTHGLVDARKLQEFFEFRQDELTKDDYLIICGDVAVCGFSRSEEKETREFLRNLPVTVLFCDGNHENFDELNSYCEEEWNGGKVHMIEPNIIHLMRGQVYEIGGRTFFVFGGAYSVDRKYRTRGATWFDEEIPSEDEYDEGWANLEKVDFQVDYVITHTGPYDVLAEMGFDSFDEAEIQTKTFQQMADQMDFKDWYFGHMHVDEDVDQFHCLWDNIVELD